jgi:S-adenosylmethionine hydrolase
MEKNRKFNVKLIEQVVEILEIIDLAHNDPNFDIFSLAFVMENLSVNLKREIIKIYVDPCKTS